MVVLAVLVAVLAATIAVLYHWSTRNYGYWEKRNIKTARPLPLVGNYRDFVLQQRDLGSITRELCQQFPREPVLGAYLATEPVAIVQDPALLQIITTKEFYNFSAREVADYTDHEVFTRSLFFTSGDHWKVLRQNMSPLFTSTKMKTMFPLIKKCTYVFEKMLNEEVEKSQLLEVGSFAYRFTMDSICACAFGIESNVMGEAADKNPFTKIGDDILVFPKWRALKLAIRAAWPSFFYGLGLKLFPTTIGEFFKPLLRAVYQERRGVPSPRQDFVDLFVSLKNSDTISGDSLKNMKDPSNKIRLNLKAEEDLLVSQAIVLFAAGYETTSRTMSFLLYELAKNPEIQEKVLAEVDEYLAARGEVQYDVTTALPYLAQCVDETLRLYPVFAVLTREVAAPCRLGPLLLERGLRVHIPVSHLHLHPDYFPDPEQFRPERFSPEGRKNIRSHTYFPFGEGPRLCIGKRFALLQLLAGLVTVLKKYRVSPAPPATPGAPPAPLRMKPVSLTQQAQGGVSLVFTARAGWQDRVFREIN